MCLISYRLLKVRDRERNREREKPQFEILEKQSNQTNH